MCTHLPPSLPDALPPSPHAVSAGGIRPSFDEEFLGALNHAAAILMTSVGHRTGLFDALAPMGWVTPEELADTSGLARRYVREWLAALATAGWIEVDGGGRYRLPPEHAAFLTRGAGPNNLAALAQHLPGVSAVESDIVEAFRTGAGVPYSRYERFHAIMAEDSAMTVLPALESHILPLVPGLTERLEAGIRVLDVGCGRGLALMQMGARFPSSRFHGIDLSPEAVEWARSEAGSRGLTNVTFEVQDATGLEHGGEPGGWDLITTFDAVHDQARPLAVLRGISRMLDEGGVYLMQDIHGSGDVYTDRENPLAPLLYAISTMHCTPVSLAQGGEGLGTMWGRPRALELLREAGFARVEVHRLEHDIQNDYFVARVHGEVGGAA